MNYYNEFDPFAAEWLRNLIAEGLIPKGIVDDRSIKEVEAKDLLGFTQCHFFAGIGGWSYALQLAAWPEDRSVWTGSCPCQPWSISGDEAGPGDERHLWPDFFRLIRECQPQHVLSEQVERAVALGWLDSVFDDLEGIGYACGAAVIPACSVGAAHERKRLWWCANAVRKGRQGHQQNISTPGSTAAASTNLSDSPAGSWHRLVAGVAGVLLGDGVSVAVERSRAHCYGNAIVPQVAAEFIQAYLEAANPLPKGTDELPI